MKISLTLVAIAALSSALILYKSQNISAVQKNAGDLIAFSAWINEHGRSYPTVEEHSFRFGVFQKTLAKIRAHDPNAPFQLGLNQFSDLTKEEFLTKFTGYKHSLKRKNFQSVKPLQADGDLPVSQDWVSKGAVNPIKNQGACGSCWAFSTVASTEAAYFLKTGTLKSFSEQQLVDCSLPLGNYACDGGLMDFGFEYFMEKGVELEADYPYQATQQDCRYQQNQTISLKPKGRVDVPFRNGHQLKIASSKTVVSVAIEAEVLQHYRGGVLTYGCGTRLDHGVAVVGYGKLSKPGSVYDGIDYWKVRNSWGPKWGEEGYFRLARYDSVGDGLCGILLTPTFTYF